MIRCLLACLPLFITSALVSAAEISTNGAGGGAWSDPATWRGKVVPGPADDVVIRKLDVVTFDRNDDGKVSCAKLQIAPPGRRDQSHAGEDPGGTLASDAGKGSRRGGKTFKLEPPFFVLATQNPIDQEGTYPLPEAQKDRFLMNTFIRYPQLAEEEAIVERTTMNAATEVKSLCERTTLLSFQELIRTSESICRSVSGRIDSAS